MQKTKRILCLLLTLVLTLGLLPSAVWAAGTTLEDYFSGMPLTVDGGSGTTAWFVDGDNLKSGNGGKSYSTSTLTITFTQDTAISFEYKVSSEARWDKCTITLKAETIADAVSGEIDWTGYTGEVNAGDVLTVTYTKDGSGDSGDDCVWLRNFSCGTPLTITFHDGESTDVQNIYGGSGTLKANSFTCDGKVFAGWAETEGSSVAYADGATIIIERNIDLYAVWADAYTVKFENNGAVSSVDVAQGYPIGAANLPDDPALTGYSFAGWFNGEEKLSQDTVISSNVTYKAKWTPITYVIRFDANGGQGNMEDLTAVYDQDVNLTENGFTRQGYKFLGWSTSSWAGSATYTDKASVINLKNTQDAVQTLYAVWEQTVFGKAYDTIAAALPADNIVKTAGNLNLPLSGEGYTVSYSGGEGEYIDAATGVVSLPDSGTVSVVLTATVTETESGKTESKDYTIILYSQQAVDTENELKAAANALTGIFAPVYGTDTNANSAVKAILESKGYQGIDVSVKEGASSSNGYSSIDQDGTIHYYYNPGMSGSPSYFYTTFMLTKDGVTVEKQWYTNLGWDEGQVRQALETELDRVTLPQEPVTELSLPQYPPKEGYDPQEDGYGYDTQNIWATITWTSSDDNIVRVGAAPSYPYYSPYSAAVTRSAVEQTVVLTATIRCNSVDGVEVSKNFTVTVQRIDEAEEDAVREALGAKLEAGFASPGLTDYVTGQALDTGNVVNDIKFPTTRDFGIDGKYYPVTITSSNTDVIETAQVNNAARVWVYRPLPGQGAESVDLTVRITEASSGIYAEKTITVTVQPLTSQEIEDEIRLMERVKAEYFEGIRNENTDSDDIKTDLHAFQEAYLDSEGELVWVYDAKDLSGRGIVPVDMQGWETLEQWRTFRSSNASVITHENLLVTRQTESKYVTITSYLSSQTLGRYAEKYPDNEDLQKLYYQPVSVTVIVTGTNPGSAAPVEEKLTVTFTLQDANSTLIPPVTVTNLPEGSTAFDVFAEVMADKGYSYCARGSYIYAITTPDGRTIEELDEGEKSGWMYSVNGVIPNTYLAAYTLSNNDNIVVFFTKDYTQENWVSAGEDNTGETGRDEKRFEDIEGHWAEDGIMYVLQNGIFEGISETLFAPDAAMNRAMLVTVLYRIDGEPAVHSQPSFTDVEEGMWYTDAIAWAEENGIAEGRGDATFGPTQDVTREQIAALLMRYANYRGYDTSGANDLTSYIDAGKISTWALETVKWANAEGLITGRTENTIAPLENATRAEVAIVVMRFMENTARR